MHGCADGAPNHMQESIKGVRHVMHKGSFVAKSACDYSSEITKGSTPDLTQKEKKVNHSSRDAKCKDGRLLAEMTDPNEVFVYDSIVVIQNVKYKKFTHRVANEIVDDGNMAKMHHLMTAGLTPDTLVYLEDMDDTPYSLEAWNGNQMIHQTKITKFEGILEGESGETADEINRRFAGDDEDEDIVLVDRPIPKPRDAGAIDFNIQIPDGCDSDSQICLALDADTTPEEFTFDLEFNVNAEEASASLTTDIVCELWPDPSLKSAKGSAEGCVTDGIKGAISLGITVCLGGSFDYESGDASPAEQTYEVDISFTAEAGVWKVDVDLEIEGSLTMKVESVNDQVYFIGYDGLITDDVSVGVASAGLGIGLDYDTQSYSTYNEPNGWGTKFYGQVTWGVDLWLWSDSGTYTHVFSCEPSVNPLCGGSGDPGPPTTFPGDKLTANESLKYNTLLVSSDGVYVLKLQSDGNLVLYAPGGRAIWDSGTNGDSSTEAIMQDDGNFVIYDQSGNAPWSSGTDGEGGTYIVMQEDGNLVIYNNNGDAVWATNTCQTC